MIYKVSYSTSSDYYIDNGGSFCKEGIEEIIGEFKPPSIRASTKKFPGSRPIVLSKVPGCQALSCPVCESILELCHPNGDYLVTLPTWMVPDAKVLLGKYRKRTIHIGWVYPKNK